MDEVSFHMSGTEAVMQAVRLARYHTGRSHVVRFCGAYHGWWDGVQAGVGNPRPAHEVYTLKEMDAVTLRVLETRDDIACVLVNPIQAMNPNGAPASDSTLVASDRAARYDKSEYGEWLGEAPGRLHARAVSRSYSTRCSSASDWLAAACRSTSTCAPTWSPTANRSAAGCPSAPCAASATSCAASGTTGRATSASRAARSTRTRTSWPR